MKIHDVEQNSPAWYALRAGNPTASEFSKLVTSKGEPSKSMPDYAAVLAAEAYAGEPVDQWEGNKYTDRGKELEAEAIALYELRESVDVERIGFVTDDKGDVGCSPDGLVGKDGMVEIKCLMAKHHVKAIIYFQKYGRCPTDYVQQAQGQMMICGREWVDLVFYHPQLPPLIIRQTPDTVIVAGLASQLPKVMAERDYVLAAIKKQAGPDYTPPPPSAEPDALTQEPVF